MPSAKELLTLKGRANYELKDRLKIRSLRVKMLADGNFATQRVRDISLSPKGTYDNGTVDR
jgi:hypothetical protein